MIDNLFFVNDERKKNMDEKNVLLLAMSKLTTGDRFKVSEYYYEKDESKVYYAYSQLEPITKLVIEKLESKGKKLDKIVIMTSKEALYEINKMVDSAAVPFYIHRIAEYVSNRNEQEERDRNACDSDKKNSIQNELVSLYSFSGDANSLKIKNIPVAIVETSDNEEINIFFEIINHIKATGTNISLYLDMQGGDRSAISQINAVVNLLQDQGVKVKGRYAIAYDQSNLKHPIHEVSKKYSAYELIGAMQAFKLYGRGQSLVGYFNDKKNEEDDKILQAIEKASDGIRLCDMNKFDDAVKEISLISATRNHNQENIDKKKTELDIVFEDITNDYGKLLNQNGGMYIAKIKWCLEKGFIQQALTIIESKIPQYLFEQKIITVDMNKVVNARNSFGKLCPGKELKVSQIIEKSKDELKKTYADNKHFIIEQLIREFKKQSYNIPNNIETINDLLKKFNQPGCKKKTTIQLNKRDSYEIKYIFDSKYLGNELENRMANFLKLHWKLKMERNNVNHGSSTERLSKDLLERYIRFYVELGEMLELDSVK